MLEILQRSQAITLKLNSKSDPSFPLCISKSNGKVGLTLFYLKSIECIFLKLAIGILGSLKTRESTMVRWAFVTKHRLWNVNQTIHRDSYLCRKHSLPAPPNPQQAKIFEHNTFAPRNSNLLSYIL